MSNTLSDSERGATRPSEFGSAAASDLAAEKLADKARRTGNLLSMTEVGFPAVMVSVPKSRAA